MAVRVEGPARHLPLRRVSAILLGMGLARVHRKGQVTIPKAVRDATGIDVGDRLVIEVREGEIVLRRPRGLLEFEPPPSTPLPWPEARRAAQEEQAARAMRALDDG